MSPERTALRLAVDAAVRARVEGENEHLALCKGCGMPRSDWTPSCKVCWSRHYKWNTGRCRRPYPEEPSLPARVRTFTEQLSQDGSRSGASFRRTHFGRAA